MYCIKCGVHLEDSEKVCPLCNTRVYHPDLDIPNKEPTYPSSVRPQQRFKPRVTEVSLTVLFLIPIIITLITDIKVNGTFDFSLYVAGAIAAAYAILVLPLWFTKPNPVIFVPTSCAAITLYVLLIDIMTGGGWFLKFALPLAVAVALIASAVAALNRYVHRAALYTAGGTIISIGALCVLIEHLTIISFDVEPVIWSIYPFVILALLGGFCIFIAAYRPARDYMERKFFF